MIRLLCLLVGYFFGAFQTAYFYGKMHGIDIRTMGSGNAGTTNTLRVLGTKAGLIVLLGDVLKTMLAIAVMRFCILPIFNVGDTEYLYVLYTAAGAILGHNFPFYMQFKGGKGVAATIGIFLAADIRLLVLAGVPALIILATTKYMSLASLTYMLLLVVTTVIFYVGTPIGIEVILLVLVLSISGFWRHRSNIKRLIRGEEVKMGQKVKIEQEKKKEE